MKKRTRFLNEEGNTTPLTIALILIFLFIICTIAEVFRISLIVQGVRDALQQATISVATANWDEAYNGLREGYSGGYVLFDDEWEENLEEEKIYEQLDEILGTEEKEEGHRKKIREENHEYLLSELKAEVINVPLRLEQASENLKVEASIKIKIPFSFGFQNLPPFEMVIKTKAVYMPKF